MAAIYDIAGTTSQSFSLGNGEVTTFYGNSEPIIEMGKIGDIYIQNQTPIKGMSTVAKKANLPSTGKFKGYYIEVAADETHNNLPTVYEWNGSSWVFVLEEKTSEGEPTPKQYRKLGRVFIKTIKDGVATWEYLKHYSFDNPIITSTESGLEAGNFKIAIQAAKNDSVVASTKANDFTNNHTQYGVTRFATDTEVNSDVDKNIVATPKQINTKINSEIEERIVQTLTSTSTTSTVPSAKVTYDTIHAEETRATGVEANLQEQIDAIESRRDVADIVSNYATPAQTGYTTLKAYDKLDKLSAKDLIKVLDDEHNDNRETYYEWVEYIVNTSSDLPTSGVVTNERARVKSPSAGQSAYWKYNGSSWTQIDITTSQGTLVLWNQIGYIDSYTRTQIDNNLVHKTGNQTETITGSKTFSSNVTVGTASNNTSINTNGSISFKPAANDGGKIDFYYGGGSTVTATIDETASGVLSLKSVGAASNSTSSVIIPTMGWVNDPTLSTNVVHRTGDESIAGAKTFTSVITGVTHVQPGATGYDNKKLATGEWTQTYVTARFGGTTTNLPAISSSTNAQVLSNNGSGFTWKTVRDISTLADLDDTSVTSPAAGQTLVYNATTSKWENGRQTTATISYW